MTSFDIVTSVFFNGGNYDRHFFQFPWFSIVTYLWIYSKLLHKPTQIFPGFLSTFTIMEIMDELTNEISPQDLAQA